MLTRQVGTGFIFTLLRSEAQILVLDALLKNLAECQIYGNKTYYSHKWGLKRTHFICTRRKKRRRKFFSDLHTQALMYYKSKMVFTSGSFAPLFRIVSCGNSLGNIRLNSTSSLKISQILFWCKSLI